ncbi:MAG TPA: acyl-CoA dehydrogenase family protein [Acidimicrobiales bacterium]|nr:acyl-CoA dehydrogenase family protein [Acidimicrobiales bacterium]
MTKVEEAPKVQSSKSIVEEIRAWLKENWDPELTVAEWWNRLGLAGWSAPTLPTNAYGRGLSRPDAIGVSREIASFGALGPPGGLGLLLAAPTIATHGTQEQIDLYVRDIVTGQRGWCQLFSEPGAGSDLAGLTTRALKDGDEWVINGQKVWTSLGQFADLGMLLARTNPEVPKHQGITWMVLDMHQPGVEVRPLREMTGSAMFNEVFISDAHVPDSAVIGDVNNGWAVANTTLAFERSGLGAGGGGGGFSAMPGTVADQLGRRAGEFVTPRSGAANDVAEMLQPTGPSALVALARANGKDKDPVIRQGLAKLHTLGEVARFNTERLKAAHSVGRDIPGLPNIAKLSMSDIMRLSRDLGMSIAGAQGTLHAYTPEERQELEGLPASGLVSAITSLALHAQAPPIYGGTDQIQRNIIGERVLGLPKEPNNDRTARFSELPKNG